MGWQLTKWPDNRFVLPAISLAVLGALLILLRGVTYGPGMGADSVGYVLAAKNFAAGNGFVLSEGVILTWWPPLFPILLSAGPFFGFDPVGWAGLLNATFFGMAVFIASRWLQRHLKEIFLVFWATLAILLSPPLTTQASRVMSDFTFILFTLISLIHIEKFLSSRSNPPLVCAAIFTGLACLTRYLGVTLVCTGILLLFFTRETLLAKTKHIATYTLIAVIPTGVWLLRNTLLSEPIVGGREPSDLSLLDVSYDVIAVSTSWIVPGFSFGVTHPVLAGILVLAISTALICVPLVVLRDPETEPDRKLAIVVFGTFAAIYVTFLTAASIFVAFNRINDRLLSPIYIPLVFVGALTVDRWLPSIRRRGVPVSDWCRWGLSLWLVYLAVINTSNIHFAVHHGTSIYSSKHWRASNLMQAIRQRLTDLPADRIYSNSPTLVYIHTGLHPGHFPIYRHSLPGPLREMRQTSLIVGDVYLIWWHQHPQPFDPPEYSITELEERFLPDPRRVLDDSDGIVYRVNFRERFAKDLQKAGEPIIRSVFDVYLAKTSLIYMKDSCTQEDESLTIFLHVVPVDVSDLPDSRKRFGFDNLDFLINTYGGNVGGRCLAQVTLPEYPIAKIFTGQIIQDPAGDLSRVWKGSFEVMETAEGRNVRMGP